MFRSENLEQRTSTNWTRGFNNLFRAELSRWFKRRAFFTHLLLWCGCINGIILLLWLQSPNVDPDVLTMTFSVFAGLAPSFGIIVLMQGSIVGEIKTGTASWILSKPITRESYILAKWFANSIGAIITMILVPTFLFYIQLALFTDVILNLTMFILVIVVLTLNMLFYLSLTLLMGSFQRNSALVIAVPIAFYLSQQFLLEIFTFLVDVTPWILTAPLGDNSPSVVFSLITGIQSFSILPILAISLYVVFFLILSLKIMQTQEI